MSVSSPTRGADPRDHRDRARQAAAVQGRADHDGPRRRRQGDADADRGPARAGVRHRPSSATRARVGSDARADHRQLRRQAAPVPGRLDRRARGQRHGQRPRDGRRAPARAEPLADPRGGPRRRACCGPRSTRSPPRPTRPACEIVAGDTKVVERGHADEMYVCTTGRRPASTRARRCRRGRCAPATGSSSPARSANHGTAIMLARGEFGLDAEIESRTRCSLWPAADALLEAAGPSLRALRDATRGGVASVLNELARASGVAIVRARGRRAGGPGRGGRGGDPRDRPDVRRQRGQARRVRRAGGRGRGAGRAARRATAASGPPRSEK